MEHLSADRLADIISTDRAAPSESDRAIMWPAETQGQDPAADQLSGGTSVDTADDSAGWEPTASQLFSAGGTVKERTEPEPALEPPAFEAASFEERLADGRRHSPRADADPVVVDQAIPSAVSEPEAVSEAEGAWAGGRHRRPKGRKLRFRNVALTSVLLAVMGVLTLIVVVSAMF
jgi:hypothetical protein